MLARQQTNSMPCYTHTPYYIVHTKHGDMYVGHNGTRSIIPFNLGVQFCCTHCHFIYSVQLRSLPASYPRVHGTLYVQRNIRSARTTSPGELRHGTVAGLRLFLARDCSVSTAPQGQGGGGGSIPVDHFVVFRNKSGGHIRMFPSRVPLTTKKDFHSSLPSICMHVTPHHRVHFEQFFFQKVALVIGFLFLAHYRVR